MLDRLIPALALSLLLPACGSGEKVSPATPSQIPAPGPTLSPTLTSGCLGWPGVEFSASNRATVTTFLRAGEPAVEFTLRDVNDRGHTLSELLRTRPVLLVHGSFT